MNRASLRGNRKQPFRFFQAAQVGLLCDRLHAVFGPQNVGELGESIVPPRCHQDVTAVVPRDDVAHLVTQSGRSTRDQDPSPSKLKAGTHVGSPFLERPLAACVVARTSVGRHVRFRCPRNRSTYTISIS